MTYSICTKVEFPPFIHPAIQPCNDGNRKTSRIYSSHTTYNACLRGSGHDLLLHLWRSRHSTWISFSVPLTPTQALHAFNVAPEEHQKTSWSNASVACTWGSFDVEASCFNLWAPRPTWEAERSHPTEEAPFSRSYLLSDSFGYSSWL